MCDQVDYSTDAQWILWSAEALRRFLTKEDTSLRGTTPFAKICHQTQLTPALGNSTAETGHWKSDNASVFVTPSIFEAEQCQEVTEQPFGGLTTMMAIDDDMWDHAVLVSMPT
jgi:hypothetical protein